MKLELKKIEQGSAKPVLLMVYDENKNRAIPMTLVVPEGSDDTFLGVISFVHEQIHEGKMFSISVFAEAVIDDGLLELAIQTGVKELHLTAAVQTEGNAVAYLYEGTDFDLDGNIETPMNKKRSSGTLSTAVVREGATINNVGAELESVYLAGGAGGRATGAATGERNEWVLEPNQTYLVRIQNIAGNAKILGVDIEWYELNV